MVHLDFELEHCFCETEDPITLRECSRRSARLTRSLSVAGMFRLFSWTSAGTAGETELEHWENSLATASSLIVPCAPGARCLTLCLS